LRDTLRRKLKMESEAKSLLIEQAREAIKEALKNGMSCSASIWVKKADLYLSVLAGMEGSAPAEPKTPSQPVAGGCGAAPEPTKPAKASKTTWKPRCKFGEECKHGIACKFFHPDDELQLFKDYTVSGEKKEKMRSFLFDLAARTKRGIERLRALEGNENAQEDAAARQKTYERYLALARALSGPEQVCCYTRFPQPRLIKATSVYWRAEYYDVDGMTCTTTGTEVWEHGPCYFQEPMADWVDWDGAC
jgi:hypothetical protein